MTLQPSVVNKPQGSTTSPGDIHCAKCQAVTFANLLASTTADVAKSRFISHLSTSFQSLALCILTQCCRNALQLVFFKQDCSLNPLKPELNPICYLLALLAHHLLHVGRIRVKSLTLRLLMSYIYGAPILDVSRSHTTTQHSR